MKNFICILDYGIGNHSSIINAFKKIGFRCYVSSSREALIDSDLIILPGVGAFASAMDALKELGLVPFIKEQVIAGKPMIGLCLGMQLLADKSYEHGVTDGLGLIPGDVVRLSKDAHHIGWNSIHSASKEDLISSFDKQLVYFNHSYEFLCDSEFILASAKFQTSLTAAVKKDKIVGLQFHPEKSQDVGLRMLKKIAEDLISG